MKAERFEATHLYGTIPVRVCRELAYAVDERANIYYLSLSGNDPNLNPVPVLAEAVAGEKVGKPNESGEARESNNKRKEVEGSGSASDSRRRDSTSL